MFSFTIISSIMRRNRNDYDDATGVKWTAIPGGRKESQ